MPETTGTQYILSRGRLRLNPIGAIQPLRAPYDEPGRLLAYGSHRITPHCGLGGAWTG